MERVTLKDLAIDHDYYASGCNYYSNDAGCKFNAWSDFFEEFGDSDIDMNLVYRWDVYKNEDPNNGEYFMKVIIIGQRKGIYMPVIIQNVNEADVKQILSFMKKHWEKLKSIWQPISSV